MKNSDEYTGLNKKRRAGVLLHPTSLPGPLLSGDIGHEAYRFIEFLKANGFKVWQMLPLGPTHDDSSPYQCLSTHAGNPELISLDWLEERGWLERNNPNLRTTDHGYRHACLRQAAINFYNLGHEHHHQLEIFKEQRSFWLDDYALFVALKASNGNKPWFQWPEKLRHRDSDALRQARLELQEQIRQVAFEQYVFFLQWQEMHAYARNHGVELFGDMPIFVAHDSADVWSQRDNFLIDIDGEMEVISGVPPDAFSDSGQRWGNPLYDWDYMQAKDYEWWKSRFKTQLELFDIVRIDHFRGLQACWQIPQADDTAINGRWVEVPGRDMLLALHGTFRHLPLIAEDLGVITDQVIELKESFGLPGMKVLQFAFDGNSANPHLPHNHKPDDIVYTGTHDNDTTLGWYRNTGNYNQLYFKDYLGVEHETNFQGLMSMIRLAMSSVSFLCILPMQDLLALDSASRMNIPGTVGGNWAWRFEWPQINQEVIDNISQLRNLYQR